MKSIFVGTKCCGGAARADSALNASPREMTRRLQRDSFGSCFEGDNRMDANIAQLAHETKDLLAPFLPYLLPAAAEGF